MGTVLFVAMMVVAWGFLELRDEMRHRRNRNLRKIKRNLRGSVAAWR